MFAVKYKESLKLTTEMLELLCSKGCLGICMFIV